MSTIMKKTNVKKTSKIEYTVDLTNVSEIEEIPVKFIEGKVAAGKPITTEELKLVVNYYSNKACDKCLEMNYGYLENIAKEQAPKKKAWYKRFWKFFLKK